MSYCQPFRSYGGSKVKSWPIIRAIEPIPGPNTAHSLSLNVQEYLYTPFLPFFCFFRDFVFIATRLVLPLCCRTGEQPGRADSPHHQYFVNLFQFFFRFPLHSEAIFGIYIQFAVHSMNFSLFGAIERIIELFEVLPSFLVITAYYLYCRESSLSLQYKLFGEDIYYLDSSLRLSIHFLSSHI